MNFKRTPRPGEATPFHSGGGGGGASAHGGAGFVGLSMYKDPPSGDISLEEFERFALDRLRGAFCFLGVFVCVCGVSVCLPRVPPVLLC